MLAANMTSSLQSRGHMNGPTSFPAGIDPASQYGNGAGRQAYNGGQPGLFQPPVPPPQPPPNEAPRPNDNIMNRRGDLNSSLYQICLTLRRRMAEVPGFEIHMQEMEEEEADANDSTDPVTSMWNCLRRGYPLMTIFNALRPREPLEVDASRLGEAKVGKKATFMFLQACLKDLNFPASECFLITDLYGGDTTGFVKVSPKTLCRISTDPTSHAVLPALGDTAWRPSLMTVLGNQSSKSSSRSPRPTWITSTYRASKPE